MLKKLFMTSITASLLISMPLIADHHHKIGEKAKEQIAERVAEKLVEAKTQEKSGLTKLVNGSLQFLNKTAPFLAAAIGAAVYWNGPFFNEKGQYMSQDQARNKAILQGALAGGASWVVLKYGTAAAMSQENIKPLAK